MPSVKLAVALLFGHTVLIVVATGPDSKVSNFLYASLFKSLISGLKPAQQEMYVAVIK